MTKHQGNTILAALLLLIAGSATAGSIYCPEATAPKCQGDKCQCTRGRLHIGDPVNAADGNVYHRTTDLELRGDAPLKFIRTYGSVDGLWTYDGAVMGLPKPFGSSPTNVNSLHWWHNYYSFVTVNGSSWGVRTTDGQMLQYYACSGTVPCQATAGFGSAAIKEVLWWYGDHFQLQLPNGERFDYTAPWPNTANPTRYFLTQTWSPTLNSPATTIAYSNPQGLSCPSVGPTGAPYISTITGIEGNQLRLHYLSLPNTQSTSECILDYIAIGDRNGGAGETRAITYSYRHNGAETAGVIRSALWGSNPVAPERSELYNEDAGYISFLDGEHGVLSAYTQPGVAVEYFTTEYPNGGNTISYAPSGSTCPYSGGTCYDRTTTALAQMDGSGTNSGSSCTTTYSYKATYPDIHEPYLAAATRNGGTNCGEGADYYVWAPAANGVAAHEGAIRNRAGAWQTFTYSAPLVGVPQQWIENTEIKRGATDASGNNALSSTQYHYSYVYDGYSDGRGAGTSQTLESETPSGWPWLAYTIRGFAAPMKPAKVIRTGNTRAATASGMPMDSSASTLRSTGMFFLYSRSTGGNCVPGSDDAGRVVEVQGPCWVAAGMPNSCEDHEPGSTGAYPLTQYTYWPITEPGNRAGHIWRRLEFPNGCTSTPLVTEYREYDAFGNPTVIRDPNLVDTAYEYTNGRITRRTVSGATTTYRYENDQLVSIGYPEGNFDVFCYRTTGTSTLGCQGPWSRHIQWQAKSEFSDGRTWSEKKKFQYDASGNVKMVTTCGPCLSSGSCMTAACTVETTRSFENDGIGRLTFEKQGDASGAFVRRSGFNVLDRLAALGEPFSNAPAWCGGAGDARSKRCKWLDYDRLERLEAVSSYVSETDATPVKTCIDYAPTGEASRVLAGCQTSEACHVQPAQTPNPNLPQQCQNAAATYQYDSFGNILSATIPGTSGDRSIRFDYDASGNVVKKDTPVERAAPIPYWHEMTYDQLGRPTELRQRSTTTPYLFYSFYYDDDGDAISGCAPTTNTKGRLRQRNDSFGRTWYRYDSSGRITKEIRARTGWNSCIETGSEVFPHTSYSYSTNGNLLSITHPHGRTIRYYYGAAAGKNDRIDHINMTFWDGTQWIERPLIANVSWNSYGGLHAYEFLALNTSPSGVAVEYLTGDDGSQQPSPAGAWDCGIGRPSGATSDHTGRTRAIWVSRAGMLDAESARTGDIMKKFYTWSGTLLGREETCILSGSGTLPRRDVYSYDQLPRLTQALSSSPAWGPFQNRYYGYDARGNRTSETNDSKSYSLTFGSGALADQLTKRAWGQGNGQGRSYTYDQDGRANWLNWPTDSTDAPNYSLRLQYADDDTVVGSVWANRGGTYVYYYDAFGQRRRKTYPLGGEEEYFYDAFHRLIEDRGSYSETQIWDAPIDDYVYIDNIPVAFIRSSVTSGYTRHSDFTGGTCQRRGDPTPCSAYAIITDYLQKPVLLVDYSRRVAGTGEYDPFGHVNRAIHTAETSHPYPAYSYSADYDLSSLSQPTPSSNLSTRIRMLFGLVDTESYPSYGTVYDYAYFTDLSNIRLTAFGGGGTSGTYGGRHKNPFWTEWMNLPASGSAKVRFHSDMSNYCPTATGITCPASGTACPTCPAGSPGCNCQPTGYPYSGIATEAYEYQRYETGSYPVWIPLRFPGQYYDWETDLVSNGHREYDPSTGRYLEPDPLMLSPRAVVQLASIGMTPSVYSYASNNPLYFTDEDGRAVVRLCSFNIAGVDPNLGAPGQTAFDPGLVVDCGGESGGVLSFSVSNECSTKFRYPAGDARYKASFHLGVEETGFEEVERHERGHVDDLNDCVSQWAGLNAGAEGDYCSREACLAKASQLQQSFLWSWSLCKRNSQKKRGDF